MSAALPSRRDSMLRRLLLASIAALPLPALANDSTAELGTGGLILSRSDMISMESEDLFISKERVTVDYVFRNRSDQDIETIVAFPMPDIEANPYWMAAIPRTRPDNFLGFRVTVDGQPASSRNSSRRPSPSASTYSQELEAEGVPFYPFGEAVPSQRWRSCRRLSPRTGSHARHHRHRRIRRRLRHGSGCSRRSGSCARPIGGGRCSRRTKTSPSRTAIRRALAARRG